MAFLNSILSTIDFFLTNSKAVDQVLLVFLPQHVTVMHDRWGDKKGTRMIVVTAILDFANQEDRDKAVALSAPVQMATRQDEQGCHAYCFAADPSVPNRIQVYELWEDGPSLVAHFKHPNYADMVEVLRGVGITYTENQAYHVDKHMPVYHEDGSPRDSFWDD